MSQNEEYFNPFPGLRSFEEEEEYLFFGREKQIDELINKLSKTRFLAVVGASGSGKSSLVKSGLLPSLHSGYLAAAGSGWRICTFRPGNDPIGNLSQALCSTEILGEGSDAQHSAPVIESILRRTDQGVGETIKQLSKDHKQNLLIVVDQFEELFRFSKYEKAEHKGTRDSVTFINLLLAASKFNGIPIYVVFTMRSDFLGDCTEFRGLPEAINEGQYLIPRMTREERKAAITGPIAVGGAEISQALLTRLLNDVGDNPDQLPILQHALMRTWEYWSKNSKPEEAIDLPHYEAIGAMAKALSLHAEEAYHEIGDDKGKDICKKLFRSLTEKRDDGRGIRRPTIIKEICELAQIELPEVTRIVEIFRKPGRSFLMPPVGVELREETVIDISHESLMRVWERLINWVQEEIESAELYTRLAQSAALYQEGKTGLWRDPELQMAINWKLNQNPNQVWAKRYDPSFDRAINYLDYSESEKNRAIQGAERKRKAAILRLRIFISIITVAFCLAVYFGVSSYQNEKKARLSERKALIKKREADMSNKIATEERDNAARERDLASQEKEKAEKSSIFATQQKKIAEGALVQVRTSLVIAEEARQRARDSALAASIQRKEAVMSAKIAKTETEKAIASKREIDRLRMLAEAKNIALKSSQLVNDPNKDTLSLQLAFLSYAINRKLNGPAQNRVIYEALKAQLNRYYNKTIRSRKDVKFATGSYDQRAVIFTGTSEFVSAGDDGLIKKWEIGGNPPELKMISSAKKFPAGLSTLAASADGRLIFAGSVGGDVLAWETSKPGSVPVSLLKSETRCNNIFVLSENANEFSLAAIFDGAVKLLKVDRAGLKVTREQMVPGTLSNLKTAACYTAGNGSLLLLAAGKSIVQVKIDDNGNFSSPETIAEFSENISALAIRKDGKFLSVGGVYGAISNFRLSASKLIYHNQVRGSVSAISALCFSANDSLLVSGSLDHSIRISRLYRNGEDEDLLFIEKDAWIRGLDLSPDGRFVVSCGQNGLIQAWPLTEEKVLNEVKAIKSYASYLSGNANETRIKEELGDKLFKSLGDVDEQNRSFKELWESLQNKFLN